MGGKEVSNSFTIGKRKSPGSKSQGISSTVDVQLETAIKIISIYALMDDEHSSEFFSSFDSFSKVSSVIDYYGLNNGDKADETEFLKDPIRFWMETLMILFISLLMLRTEQKMSCDVIMSDRNEDGEILGYYISLTLTLQSYDWKTHKVDIFVPYSEKNFRPIFFIDDVPILVYERRGKF